MCLSVCPNMRVVGCMNLLACQYFSVHICECVCVCVFFYEMTVLCSQGNKDENDTTVRQKYENCPIYLVIYSDIYLWVGR